MFVETKNFAILVDGSSSFVILTLETEEKVLVLVELGENSGGPEGVSQLARECVLISSKEINLPFFLKYIASARNLSSSVEEKSREFLTKIVVA